MTHRVNVKQRTSYGEARRGLRPRSVRLDVCDGYGGCVAARLVARAREVGEHRVCDPAGIEIECFGILRLQPFRLGAWRPGRDRRSRKLRSAPPR